MQQNWPMFKILHQAKTANLLCYTLSKDFSIIFLVLGQIFWHQDERKLAFMCTDSRTREGYFLFFLAVSHNKDLCNTVLWDIYRENSQKICFILIVIVLRLKNKITVNLYKCYYSLCYRFLGITLLTLAFITARQDTTISLLSLTRSLSYFDFLPACYSLIVFLDQFSLLHEIL